MLLIEDHEVESLGAPKMDLTMDVSTLTSIMSTIHLVSGLISCHREERTSRYLQKLVEPFLWARARRHACRAIGSPNMDHFWRMTTTG